MKIEKSIYIPNPAKYAEIIYEYSPHEYSDFGKLTILDKVKSYALLTLILVLECFMWICFYYSVKFLLLN